MFFMATTQISSEKTAAEIQMLLGLKGAKKILIEYESSEISAISFTVDMAAREIAFRLPIRWRECLLAMKNDRTTPNRYCNDEQAKRTAWRVVFRWLQAQLAFVDSRMVTLPEIMLPYAQVGDKTFYEAIAEKGFKALPNIEREE